MQERDDSSSMACHLPIMAPSRGSSSSRQYDGVAALLLHTVMLHDSGRFLHCALQPRKSTQHSAH